MGVAEITTIRYGHTVHTHIVTCIPSHLRNTAHYCQTRVSFPAVQLLHHQGPALGARRTGQRLATHLYRRRHRLVSPNASSSEQPPLFTHLVYGCLAS